MSADVQAQLIEYFGPDRGFILRFFEEGTDVRTAKSYGPTVAVQWLHGVDSGSIAPRSFFHSMSSDMEQAAQQLRTDTEGICGEMDRKNLKKNKRWQNQFLNLR